MDIKSQEVHYKGKIENMKRLHEFYIASLEVKSLHFIL